MKNKNAMRIFGCFQTLVFGGATAFSTYMASKGSYFHAVFVPPLALCSIDGVVDIVKGTHHYFLCNLAKYLVRSEETKQKIESDLEKITKFGEEDFSLKK